MATYHESSNSLDSFKRVIQTVQRDRASLLFLLPPTLAHNHAEILLAIKRFAIAQTNGCCAPEILGRGAR